MNMKCKYFVVLAVAGAMALSAAKVQAQAYLEYELDELSQPAAEQIAAEVEAGQKDLQTILKPYLKQFKRKDEALLAIGAYCYNKELYSPAISLAQYVYERKYYEDLASIQLEGDCYFELQRYGEAAAKYEEAIMLEPDDRYAYFRKVDVYKYINPGYSLEAMGEIKERYPDDPEIDKAMASIYYFLNDTANANASYETYFKNVKYEDDVPAATEFAVVRFINKDYQASLDIVNTVIGKAPQEISLNRMKFYDLYELERFDEAKTAGEHFFTLYIDTLYNFSDYKYMGNVVAETGDNEKASEYLEVAADKAANDKNAQNNGSLFKELSTSLRKIGSYDKAAEAYQRYIDIDKPGSVPELLNKGRIYYVAAGDTAITEEAKAHYIAAGDSIYASVSEQAPDSYLGPYWRGRINASANPDGAVEAALTHYSEAYDRLADKSEDYDAIRVECLRYMMFYYLQVDDYEKCKEYMTKILELDPEDGLANQVSEGLQLLGI